MNKKLKDKWVKALRSGEYKQAQGQMRDLETGGFCCLGVLCDVQGVTRYKKINTWAHPAINNQLSPKIRETLAKMNDDGSSFKQIANYIEKNL